MDNSTKKKSSGVVLKAGIWYTVSNFVFRGMAFITTPVFTRLLTKGEYGDFSNFASWMSILVIITSCDLQTSIIRSKLEFEDDIDSYIFSMLGLTTLITAFFYVVFLVFDDFIFNSILAIDKKYIHIMFFYLFCAPAYSMFVTKHRAFYKYRVFSIMTGISIALSLGTSLILVVMMNDKLMGRIIGQYIPAAILSLILYIFLAIKGKRIQIKYWKYALVICIPLVPHLLSMNILSSSDRILIRRISGAEYAALFSIAHSCANIVSILLDSMNKAWAPWFLDTLHSKDYSNVKPVTKPYFLLFVSIAGGIFLLGPEVILILGGKAYLDAIFILPPLIMGCVVQFVYTMYVQVEFYEKKTIGVAIGTISSAAINIVLNLIFIHAFGYRAAAYVTLIGYICLLFYHYNYVKRLGYKDIFDRKLLFGTLLILFLAMFGIMILYNYTILRYIITLVYGTVILFMIFKHKGIILSILRK